MRGMRARCVQASSTCPAASLRLVPASRFPREPSSLTRRRSSKSTVSVLVCGPFPCRAQRA